MQGNGTIAHNILTAKSSQRIPRAGQDWGVDSGIGIRDDSRGSRWQTNVVRNPAAIAPVAAIDVEHQELRSIVGMTREDQFFEGAQQRACGLDEQQKFGAGFEVALPPVMRFESGNEIDAGGEARLEDVAGEGASGFAVGDGNKNEGETGFHVREESLGGGH